MWNFKITFREHISGLSWISKTGSKVDAELSIFDKRSELKFYKVSRSDQETRWSQLLWQGWDQIPQHRGWWSVSFNHGWCPVCQPLWICLTVKTSSLKQNCIKCTKQRYKRNIELNKIFKKTCFWFWTENCWLILDIFLIQTWRFFEAATINKDRKASMS